MLGMVRVCSIILVVGVLGVIVVGGGGVVVVVVVVVVQKFEHGYIVINKDRLIDRNRN